MRRNAVGAALFLMAALTLTSSVGYADTPSVYVVQPGDTLYSLARRTGTTVSALVELNGIGSDFVIRVGQRLLLPAGTPPEPTVAPAAPDNGEQRYAAVRPAAEAGPEWFDRGTLIVRPSTPAPDSPAAGAPAPADDPPAPPPAAGPAAQWIIPCTADERMLLARLVTAEAGNEPLEGQVGVAAVVVNRVRHPGFPKTVTAVIQEPGQFKAVELGRVGNTNPGPNALAAVDRALSGEDPTNGAIFFYNPAKSVAMDFWRTRPVTAVIGGHNFAR